MLEHSLKVAHIVGSIIARRTAKQVERAGSIEIDLSDEVLPAHHRHSLGGLMPQYLDQVDPTDTFVIITPEYNREYPASLRQAIDLGADEWSAKPAGFVSYGGVAGGARVVEHLRQVFPEFHAATLRDTVTDEVLRQSRP